MWIRFQFLSVVVFSLWGVGQLHAVEQDGDREQAAMVPVRGQVVDSANQPVEGVRVSFVRWEAPDGEKLPSTTTDATGRFDLEIALDEFDLRRGSRPNLVAIDAAGRIGWRGPRWARQFRRETIAKSVDLEQPIKLLDVEDHIGSVVNDQGQPAANALVRPLWISTVSFPEVRDVRRLRRSVDGLLLPNELQEDLGTRTDEQGRFKLRNVPTKATITALVEADGYGAPRLTWALENEATLKLVPAVTLRGRLKTSADEDVIKTVRLRMDRQTDQDSFAASSLFSFYNIQTPSANGAFEFTAPRGEYRFKVYLDDRTDWYAEAPEKLTVDDGEERPLEIPLLRAQQVRGRVVSAKNGTPVEGTTLSFHQKDPAVGTRYLGEYKTDKDGVYLGYARPGEVSIRVYQVPKGFRHISGNAEASVTVVEGEKSALVPDIKLEPAAARAIKIVVVDEKGDAVPQAEIRIVAPFESGGTQMLRADEQGRYTLKSVDPLDTLPIRARAGDRTSDGALVVDVGKVKQPVRVVVSPKFAFRLSGVVIDSRGTAVRDAQIALQWNSFYASRRHPGGGVGMNLANYHTDSKGRFTSGPLWPGDRYRLKISADGTEVRQTVSIRGEAGQTHDLGKITLTSTQGIVAGQVVDGEDNVIPDALVFNSGDARTRLQTRSDAEGRFRLSGFREGPVAVFVQTPGFRLAGARTTTGTHDLVIRLTGTVDSAPDRGTPMSAKERKELARWMLERLHQVPAGQRGEINFLILRYMARIDPDRALEWLEKSANPRRADVLLTIAESLIDDDPDEALAFIARAEGSRYFDRVHQIASRLVKKNPEAASRLAEDLVFRARQVEPPNQVYCLAQTGRLLVELGEFEAGHRLLDEAFKAASGLAGTGRGAFVRGFTAEQIAPLDPDRAFALIKPLQDSRAILRHMGNVAVAISPRDRDRALELAKGTHPNVSLRIAYGIAPVDLAKAEELLRDLPGTHAERNRAEGLGWLAQAVYRDRPRDAFRLIDESLAICLEFPKGFDSWVNFGWEAPVAAHAAVLARQVGYDNMPSVVARVLACRRTDMRARSELSRLRSVIHMAMILAVVDRDTARWLLEPIRQRPDLLGEGGYASLDRDDWLMAWSIIDPEMAKKLFEQEIRRQLDGPTGRLGQGALTKTIETLTSSSEQFVQSLAGKSALWFPDQE